MKFKKLLIGTMASLAALASVAYASIPLGGSIFPLTYITQPPINLTDAFNEMLSLVNQQTVGISTTYAGSMTVPTSGIDTSGVTFSTTIQQNPLVQATSGTVNVSGVGGATTGLDTNTIATLVASESGRKIIPTSITLNASGTAATATAVALECSDGTLIASWPIADLVNNTPIGVSLNLSTQATITHGLGLINGCASGKSLQMSNVGSTLTTTSQMGWTIAYTVQ